jgi:hypothetical protein
MRFSRVARESDSQCSCRRFDPSIIRRSRILGAADEAVLNKVQQNKQMNIRGFFMRKAFPHTVQYVCLTNDLCYV